MILKAYLLTMIYYLYIDHCFAQGDKTEGIDNTISSGNQTEQNNTENITNSTQPSSDGKEILRISVYYETLCPGSMEFFVEQLEPVMKSLGSLIHVHLVPYGHVKEEAVGDGKELKCQHGPNECLGNKIHACVVDSLKNNTEAVLFNACLVYYTLENYPMTESYENALDPCGIARNVNISEIKECLHSNKSDILFKMYGEETTAFYKKYNGDAPVKPYVPYAVFENQGLNNTEDRKNNFMSNICDAIKPRPEICDDDDE